jgi:methyl-accepting chemotaxis protein
MSFFNNLSIRLRIMLVLLIPLIGLFYFNGERSYKEYVKMDTSKELIQIAELSPHINATIHHLQYERGKVAAYLSEGNVSTKSQARSQLEEVYQETDKVIAELAATYEAQDHGVYGDEFTKLMAATLEKAKGVISLRTSISSEQASQSEITAAYTQDISMLLDLVEYLGTHAESAEAANHFAAYLALMKQQEEMGKERALGAVVLSRGMITANDREELSSIIGQQKAYEDMFLSYAVPEDKQEYDNDVTNNAVYARIGSLREMFLDFSAENRLVSQISPTDWFDNLTAGINQLSLAQTELENKIAQYAEKSYASARNIFYVTAATGVIVMLVTAWMMLVVSNSLTGSVQKLTEAMQELANDHIDIEIPDVGKGHDLAVMSETLTIFRDNIIKMREMEEQQKAAEVRQTEERKAAMLKLADDFESRVGTISNAVARASEQMQVLSQSLSAAVEETTAQCSAVVSSADDANRSVQTVAAASEEMTAAINEVSRNVNDTADTARTCRQTAENSQRQLDHLNSAIGDIDSVIQSINDVAEQTNLLALNATIEAARAGEAGKGFAVVASEVKNLASQTHNMTEEITARVGSIKDTAQTTIQAISNIIQQISEVDGKTSNVASAMEQQTATTREISTSAQTAAAGASAVSGNIQNIQEAASESAQSCTSLKEASDILNTEAVKLKSAMGEFLSEIRAS